MDLLLKVLCVLDKLLANIGDREFGIGVGLATVNVLGVALIIDALILHGSIKRNIVAMTIGLTLNILFVIIGVPNLVVMMYQMKLGFLPICVFLLTNIAFKLWIYLIVGAVIQEIRLEDENCLLQLREKVAILEEAWSILHGRVKTMEKRSKPEV